MPRKPTSLFSLIAYSGPAIPLAMLGLPLILYLPPFYAGELGMDLAAVGIVFALARMWDAVIDPLIGYWSDKTGGRFGRRKPWLVAGASLWMLGVYALLSPPESANTVYLWFAAFGFYVAWTMVQIPYQSWGVELSRQYEERFAHHGHPGNRHPGGRDTGDRRPRPCVLRTQSSVTRYFVGVYTGVAGFDSGHRPSLLHGDPGGASHRGQASRTACLHPCPGTQ